MALPLFETVSSQPPWILLLLFPGVFTLSIYCFSLFMWVYFFFLRKPKNILEYGRWAIITGPTSGIGKALACKMARKGLNLVLVGRSKNLLRHLAEEIKSEVPNTKILTIVFDLSCNISEGIFRLEEAIEGLDIGVLVNNAGVSYPVPKRLHEVERGFFEELVHVNLEALTDIIRVVLPKMMRKRKGAIVNVGSGSCAVATSFPMFAVYIGTKGYVNSLSRSLHQEYKNHNIDIQCQIPSYVVTKMVPDKKHSFFNPTPEEFADPMMHAIGYGSTVIPYWPHSIQILFALLVPEKILTAFLLRSILRYKENRLSV